MAADPNERLIFLHLPKTAGVNVRELLTREYPGPRSFIRGSPDHRELFRMSRKEREAYLVVGGHYRFGLHLLFDSPSRYLTFLRDPVERVISHFAYIQWQKLHAWHARVTSAGITLEQWVRFGLADAWDNLQVRRLTLRADDDVPFEETTRQMLDEAKRVLSDQVDFLGITERYEESVRLFAQQLGWQQPVAIERLNVSPNRQSAADLPPSTRAAILEHNELDIELYTFAADLFERRLSSTTPPRTSGLLSRLAGQVRALRHASNERG